MDETLLLPVVEKIRETLPTGVSMTYSMHNGMDGVSFFFHGPRGKAAQPFYGVTPLIEDGRGNEIVSQAATRAATIA